MGNYVLENRVRPLEQREYGLVQEAVAQGKMDGLTVNEQGDFGLCIAESRKYNGGYVCEHLEGDTYKPLAYAFGEQDYLGKWYCKPGYMDKNIQSIIDSGRGSPVWFVTAIVYPKEHDEHDVTGAIVEFGKFFDTWHNSYTTIMPVGKHDTGLEMKYTAFRYIGRTDEVVLYARQSNGELVRSNLGIVEWANIDKLIERLCKADVKELKGMHFEKVQRSGATLYSVVRGYLLTKRDPVGIDQMNMVSQKGGNKHSVARLCYIFGASPAQAYLVAKDKYSYVVAGKLSGVTLPPPNYYEECGLTDQYLLNISITLHVGYKPLVKGIEDRNITTSEGLRALIDELYAKSRGFKGRMNEESHEDMLARVWRGMRAGSNDTIPDEIFESLHTKGISTWVIMVSWDIDFNYHSYVGRLLWLEKRAQRIGVSVEEWAKSSRLDFDKVLRRLQYSIDNVVEAEGTIAKCYEEIPCSQLEWAGMKKATVPSLAKRAGGNLQQYLELYRSLSLGIEGPTVSKLSLDVKRRLYSICKIVSNMPIKTYAVTK